MLKYRYNITLNVCYVKISNKNGTGNEMNDFCDYTNNLKIFIQLINENFNRQAVCIVLEKG